ncbi:MAG: hypothetical protein CL912_20890 [Deltaproteobacteria bacterium]|nr:hypothetical protein [Deltaproteobacteria bacterium]
MPPLNSTHSDSKIYKYSRTNQSISVVLVPTLGRFRNEIDSRADQKRLGIIEANQTKAWEDD